MALTNKSIASTYGDILQVDNGGSGRTASGTVVRDGLGNPTSITLGNNKLNIKPATDSTSCFLVEANDGTDLLLVDTTNKLTKAGSTQSYINTQVKEFGVFDFSPTSNAHHAMVSMNGLTSASSGEDIAPPNFGTGTDPATTATITADADMLTACIWYIPVDINIDEVRIIGAGDSADDLNFHLFSYAMATGTGSGAGDLSDGTLLAHNGSTLTVSNDRITTTTLSIDSASVSSGRVVLGFVENVGAATDLTAQLIVKYHYQ